MAKKIESDKEYFRAFISKKLRAKNKNVVIKEAKRTAKAVVKMTGKRLFYEQPDVDLDDGEYSISKAKIGWHFFAALSKPYGETLIMLKKKGFIIEQLG